MDIQNIDLRRKDFEASHPTAKTFIFNEETMLYSGPKVEILNGQWTTWCACIGIMHFEGLEVQAIPEGFVLVQKECSDEMAEVIAATANVCGGIAGDIYDAVVKQALVEAAEGK